MDQAKGLRQMAHSNTMNKIKAITTAGGTHYPNVLAITSGKGGVGKTNLAGNLAVALSRMGQRVVIIDADVGLANIDIVFNLRPEYNIRHVVSGEKTLNEVMVKTEHGIGIIPGGSGFADLTRLSHGEKLTLLSEFETLADQADVILLDTGAGISSNVLYFNAAADQCLVVATTEPTSITDAYALVKVMSQEHGVHHFKLVVNMVQAEADGKRVYHSLSTAMDRFLKNVVLEYIGCIPFDDALQKAVLNRRILLDGNRHSLAGNAMINIAKRLADVRNVQRSQGNLTFFMNRVFESIE
ncbi:MAG: flagellar synthesis regulator FleN [Desulfobacterales bacterium]|nr:MAG: flagellar synthesis regulator FleN [Desulfobacterales bacterium]